MTKPKVSSAEHEHLMQTVQMFEVIAETQPNDIQSLEILKEAYLNLGRDADAVGVSKRIAKAYLRLGQLSSAILEYEGVLQRFPNDAECLAALGELEGKMTSLAGGGTGSPGDESGPAADTETKQAFKEAAQFEDANEALVNFFREQKLLSEKDAGTVISAIASATGQNPSNHPPPSLIAIMSDRGIASLDKSLALLAEKTRLPYIPLNIYDVDSGMIDAVGKDFCTRHLVLPFDRVSKIVFVATVNPFDARAKKHVESKIDGRIQWYLTSPADLTAQLKDISRIT